LKSELRIKPGRTDFNNALNETADPENQFSIRSSMTLPYGVEFDTGLRWIDSRIINNSGVPAIIPSYFEMDARLGWDLPGPAEISIVGQNLLHRRHPEYGLPGPAQVGIGRAVYGKVTWRM
jgi:iron complex outermembrane receptor protein